MNFSDYLKNQLTDFVDVYRKYFWKTFNVVLIFSALVFIVSIVSFFLNSSDTNNFEYQYGLINFFYYRLSLEVQSFQLIGVGKILFIFFSALLSMSILKLEKEKSAIENSFSLSSVISGISLNNFFKLLILLFFSVAVDYFFGFVYSNVNSITNNQSLIFWMHSIIFKLRIYFPLILFSITIYKSNDTASTKVNFKRLMFLFVSLWLFNEFGYELITMIRYDVLDLIKSFLKTPMSNFYFNSITDILLISILMAGYHSAMSTSLKLSEQKISVEEINTTHE